MNYMLENRFNRSGRIKSQRLINAVIKAKRENPDMTMQELYYVAFGFQESGR